MARILPWAAYILSVLISWKFCAGYWVVGPVFWLALLAANYGHICQRFSPRHLALGFASTLVYALIYWMANNTWQFRREWVDMLAGGLTAGVILGSILMPSIQALLFGMDFKTAGAVSLALILSWYGVNFISWVDEAIGVKPDIDYGLIAIALWQGIYLRRLKPILK